MIAGKSTFPKNESSFGERELTCDEGVGLPSVFQIGEVVGSLPKIGPCETRGVGWLVLYMGSLKRATISPL